MNKRKFAVLLALLVTIAAFAGCGAKDADPDQNGSQPAEVKGTIRLATTTSTKDSGLLDYILPDFTAKTGWEVDVIPVGSGEAMAMGQNGEADVLLVHSPAAEKAFVAEGHADADERMDVMYNDFVLVGPETDPAAVKESGATDAIAAFKAIAESKSPFISRADKSGTHSKELSIWEKAEITPEGDWYVEAAAGMGAVITMADEKLAYTLADRATWLNVGQNTELVILSEKDPSAVYNNQYGVICVNTEKNEAIQGEGAKAFQTWIVSKETQNLIGTYGVEDFGAALFTPNAK